VTLQATDPKIGLGDPAGKDGHQSETAETIRTELPCAYLEPKEETTVYHCFEAQCELAGLLKAGTRHLSLTTLRQLIQVEGEGAEGSLDAISEEVLELFEYSPYEDPIEQAESVVQTFEDDILEWEWTRTIRPDSDAGTELDPAWEPMGEDLLDILEEILTKAEDVEGPTLVPVDN
jgi:hypothetical protein